MAANSTNSKMTTKNCTEAAASMQLRIPFLSLTATLGIQLVAEDLGRLVARVKRFLQQFFSRSLVGFSYRFHQANSLCRDHAGHVFADSFAGFHSGAAFQVTAIDRCRRQRLRDHFRE